MYLKPEFRGNHIVPKFMEHIQKIYSGCIFRLEVEEDNTHAVYVYKKLGFDELPYTELKK